MSITEDSLWKRFMHMLRQQYTNSLVLRGSSQPSFLLAAGGTSGWCIGSGLNIVYFFMLSSRSVRALKLPPAQAASFIRGGAVFRLVFICLAVIVILQFPSISLGAAVAGIFSYRVLVFADVLTARLRR